MASGYLEKLRMFNRDVRLYLITAALFGFTVFGGIYPVLLNLYLLRLGYGLEFIGIVNAALPFAVVVFSLPSGVLGQRFSTRSMMIVGLGVSMLGCGLLPLAEFMPDTWQSGWILLSYLLGGLGIALYMVNANPFLMSSTSLEERDYVFSVQAALWPLAGFGGSLVGGLLPGLFAKIIGVSLGKPAPYRYPLLIAAAALIPAVVAIVLTQKNSPKNAKAIKVETGSAPYGLISLMALVVLLQVAGEFAARTFFNVYLDADLHLMTAQIGVISAFGQLLAVPAALAAPLFMMRWGKERPFVWMSLGMALSLLPLALFPHWAGASLGFIGMAALAAITRPIITVYQQEIVSPVWQPTMSGATTMAAALSMAVIAFGGGYIIAVMGFRSLFLIGAGITVAGALLFWVYSRGHRGEIDSHSSSPVDLNA